MTGTKHRILAGTTTQDRQSVKKALMIETGATRTRGSSRRVGSVFATSGAITPSLTVPSGQAHNGKALNDAGFAGLVPFARGQSRFRSDGII
jgi:hypothetical protein